MCVCFVGSEVMQVHFEKNQLPIKMEGRILIDLSYIWAMSSYNRNMTYQDALIAYYLLRMIFFLLPITAQFCLLWQFQPFALVPL